VRGAFVFQDVLAFWDFLRLHAEEMEIEGDYRLYLARASIQHPSLLILLGASLEKTVSSSENSIFSRMKGLDVFQGFLSDIFSSVGLGGQEKGKRGKTKQPQAEEMGATIRLHFSAQKKQDFQVLQRFDAKHLFALVRLLPSPSLEAPKEHILFWLHDPSFLPTLVQSSLRLRNDRIHYAPLEDGEEKGLLVRIEAPSFYLLQLFQSLPEEVTIYHEAAPSFFVEWGYRYPLIDLWKPNKATEEARWVFLRRDALPHGLAPVKWQDVYQAAELSLLLEVEEQWKESSGVVRFTLPMRFERRTRPAEAEIWLLEETERPHLERLLSLLDEEDAAQILISIQRDAQGRHLFFLREKQRGKGRIHLDFGGRCFAPYRGIHALMMPVEMELQPQLRRDQYTRLFSLQAGVLTFVFLPTATEGAAPTMAQARLVPLREDSFMPLLGYIDYLVTQEVEQIEAIQQKSTFDLGRYSQAPYRPSLSQPERPPPQPKSQPHSPKRPDKPDAKEEAQREQKDDQAEDSRVVRRQREEEKKKEGTERSPSQIALREQELERAMLQDATMEGFLELAQLKQLQQKWLEGRDALIEALWLCRRTDEEEEKRLRAALIGLLEEEIHKTKPAKITRGVVEPRSQSLLLLSLLREGKGSTFTPEQWLQEGVRWMRESETALRKKLRWLAWRQLLRHNRDQREMARIREAMLQELNDQGLSLIEIPAFFQKRLLEARHLQKEESNDKGQAEYQLASHHLRLLRELVENLQIPRLRAIASILLAGASYQSGLLTNASSFVEHALQYATGDEEAELWIANLSQGFAKYLDEEHLNSLEDLQVRYEKALTQDKARLQQIKELQSLFSNNAENDLESLLSASNLRRLYTTDTVRIPLFAQAIETIQKHHQNENIIELQEKVWSLLCLLLDALRQEGDFSRQSCNYQEIAKTLSWLVALLAKRRWDVSGEKLFELFTRFSQLTPTFATQEISPMDGVFFMLVRLHIAQGFSAFDQALQAQTILNETLAWLNASVDYPIDFLDASGVLLHAAESLPLSERTRLLDSIASQFLRLCNPQSDVYAHFEGTALQRLCYLFFFQMMRVATSKDKLTLGLVRQYMDRDEMAIRARILSEDITQ
jgi:hypothetical protein